MKTIFTLLLFLSYISYSQSIKNIHTIFDNEKVLIEYDLEDETNKAREIEVIVKIGKNKSLVPRLISGDLTDVLPGSDKQIVWEALKEIGPFEGEFVFVINIKQASFSEIRIGSQVWMGENLNIARFRNGDIILEAKTDVEWKLAAQNKMPAWCYVNNDSVNGVKYGKLYNWHAVHDPRGLAPEGWRIPRHDEWQKLIDFLGNEPYIAAEKMKSTTGWAFMDNNGSNESNFSAFPGGFRCETGFFSSETGLANWWCLNEQTECFVFYIHYLEGIFGEAYGPGKGACHEDSVDDGRGLGYSVRCIKD